MLNVPVGDTMQCAAVRSHSALRIVAVQCPFWDELWYDVMRLAMWREMERGAALPPTIRDVGAAPCAARGRRRRTRGARRRRRGTETLLTFIFVGGRNGIGGLNARGEGTPF